MKLCKKLDKINTEAAELRRRLERLEKEKEDLDKKIGQMKLDIEKDREKRLIDNFIKVQAAVNGMQEMMSKDNNEARKKTKNLEGMMTEQITNLHTKIEKMSTETQAIIIGYTGKLEKEKEQMEERLNRLVEQNKNELIEKLEKLQQDTEERLERMAEERQQTVRAITEAISGLEERINQKLTDSHETILHKLIPLSEKVDFIEKQVSKETILIFGVKDKENATAILNGDKWTELKLNFPKEFSYDGVVYLHGEIYIFGGCGMLKKLYKRDSKTREWIRLADMNEGRWTITNSCLEWNGYIWVFGGYTKSVERYDPKENKWTKMPDMKFPRQHAAATIHNDKIIICGGYDDVDSLKSVECFDSASGEWSELNDLPDGIRAHSLVSIENRIILTSNQAVLELSNLEEGGTWKQLPTKQFSHGYGTAKVLNKEVYSIGGDSPTVEIYDGKSWRNGPPLPISCWCSPAIVIPSYLADILSYS